MESYQIEHLTFAYPEQETPALADVSLSIPKGAFVTLCGRSGCGKTTLLRQLKSVLAPHGEKSGEILFEGRPLDALPSAEQSARIGFVMQNPESQIVTDKVWHELAFGLESMGLKTTEIRARVSEMASFFGIQTWFHKNTAELSGGQKQLLNLASVMVMQPSVLILDEPTAQLDPIAASDFLETIGKINRELGTTILLSEHRLEEAFPMSDRVIVLDGGAVLADGTPTEVGAVLKQAGSDLFALLPTPMRVYAGIESALPCPITVREGRRWLEETTAQTPPDIRRIPQDTPFVPGEPVLEMEEVWVRYEREAPDVLKGMSLTVYAGECFAMVGGNGTGKSTSLAVLSGLKTPYRGKVRLCGQPLAEIKHEVRFRGLLGVLPQNPQTLFVKKTVRLDLLEILREQKLTREEQEARLAQVAELCELKTLLQKHPYDLSGGEQQRAALAKVLLLRPRILLLDEPTKGLDNCFKERFARILKRLQAAGCTIVLVSHDIEFCAAHADRCAMLFDGAVTASASPREFFGGKSFYTTAANRMARTTLPMAVLDTDIIAALGGDVRKAEAAVSESAEPTPMGLLFDASTAEPTSAEELPAPSAMSAEPAPTPRTPRRIVAGIAFLAAAILTAWLGLGRFTDWRDYAVQFGIVLALGLAFHAFFPGRELGHSIQMPRGKRHLSKRTLAATVLILLAAPLTIFVGIYYLGDRKYYFISLLLLFETMLPFFMVFESRKPQARELVVISVLCAAAVAGRAAFFMLPQFKPVAAMVILAGVCFGGETGFLVGAVIAFVSNFFFSQGPWTPWQMFAFGMIGFLAGVAFRKGLLRRTKGALCIFGFLTTVLVYGGIMNPASVLMWQSKPNAAMLLASCAMGLPFDLIHGASTVLFLWLFAEPMMEKLERIKRKYGLLSFDDGA